MPPKSETLPCKFGSQTTLLEVPNVSNVPNVPIVPKLALSQETEEMPGKAQEKAETSQPIVHIQATQSQMPIYQVGFQPQCWKHPEKSDMQQDSEVPIAPTAPKSALPPVAKGVVQETKGMQEIALDEARTSHSFQPQFRLPQEKDKMQDDSEEPDDAEEIEQDEKFVPVIQKEPEVCTCFIKEKADLVRMQLKAEKLYAEFWEIYQTWFKADNDLYNKAITHEILNQCNLSTPEAILETAFEGLGLKTAEQIAEEDEIYFGGSLQNTYIDEEGYERLMPKNPRFYYATESPLVHPVVPADILSPPLTPPTLNATSNQSNAVYTDLDTFLFQISKITKPRCPGPNSPLYRRGKARRQSVRISKPVEPKKVNIHGKRLRDTWADSDDDDESEWKKKRSGEDC
ncbi:hypothetical protein HK096_002070 [Nowakowskiella sp. JEL0078]|nr:hypothetical protein HK096_002070 [Nowakowskiella sp. JEL0078]